MADRGNEVRKEAGARVKRVRENAGLTQKELAERTGYREDRDIQPRGALTPSRIGNYEQGTRWLGWEEALTLARVFPEYHPAYFLGVITDQEARVLHALGNERTKAELPFKPAAPKEERREDRRS